MKKSKQQRLFIVECIVCLLRFRRQRPMMIICEMNEAVASMKQNKKKENVRFYGEFLPWLYDKSKIFSWIFSLPRKDCQNVQTRFIPTEKKHSQMYVRIPHPISLERRSMRRIHIQWENGHFRNDSRWKQSFFGTNVPIVSAKYPVVQW